MSLFPRLSLLFLCALAALPTVACDGPQPVTDTPVGDVPRPSFTPLASPGSSEGLQALVTAQIARDPAPLLEGLRSLDGEVAQRAALALASVQDPETLSGLVVRLADERVDVARLSAFALGRSGSGDAAGHLRDALLGADDAALRLALIRALGFTAGMEEVAALMGGDFRAGELPEVALAIARAGSRGVEDDTTLEWLITGLGSEDPGVRLGCAYYFARAQDPAIWSHRAEDVRAAVAGMAPEDRAVPHLLAGLAAVGDESDTPTFAAWSRASQDWRTRASAVQALRDRVGDRVARDALLSALDDPSPHVSEAAAAELARSRPSLRIVQEQVVAWIEANPDRWQAASLLLSGLAPLGEGGRIAAWIDALPPDQTLARAAGMEALSRVPGEAFLDRLFTAAGSDQDPVAAVAYRGLAAHWGSDRNDPGLLERYEAVFIEGLSHGHPSVVRTASRALTDPLLMERGSADVLQTALLRRSPDNPRDAEATAALLTGLSQTRDPIWVPLLERYLAHPSSVVRAAAREAIHSLTLRASAPPQRQAELVPELEMDWENFPASRPVVVMETDKGVVRIELAHTEAPLTVQTFLGFVEQGAYDGVPFHRVVPNFVVQGGDFARQDGTGGPGFALRTELTRIPFERGVLGMASGGRDTEGSQFFVMHARAQNLEDRYTSFGWVTSGMDVVDQLLRGDRILRMYRES